MIDAIYNVFLKENNSVSTEGRRGVKGLEALFKLLGYNSLEEFLEDNSGAVEALMTFVADSRVPEWKAKLRPFQAIGTCTDSFDENGHCTNSCLPWSDVTEFAQSIEEHGDNCVVEGIKIEYDSETDVHYFYYEDESET